MNFVQNTPIFNNINIPSVHFRSAAPIYTPTFEPAQDSFSTNPLIDKGTVIQAAKSNPRIMEILKEYKIPLNVNVQELEKLKRGHLMDTRITAAKIYSALPEDLKSEINLKDLQDAAMYHDYGKALIPEKILNKEGKLDSREKEIMSLHSELGYELLKEIFVSVKTPSAPLAGEVARSAVGGANVISQNALDMIKYHHQKPDGSGYPAIDNNFAPDISLEILTAADKYCALREPRSYKPAMSRDEALNILQKEVPEEIFKALKTAV